MKRLNRFILWPLFALAGFALVNAIILMYTVCTRHIILMYTVCTRQQAGQIIFLFILLALGFGTESKRRKRINNRIPNPYNDGRR